jgi:hypothetical protein
MANLRRIEEMRTKLENYKISTEPSWIRGYASSENKMHLSGILREASMNWHQLPPEIERLLDEAAEALDDAHEEWLENKLIAYRRLRDGL